MKTVNLAVTLSHSQTVSHGERQVNAQMLAPAEKTEEVLSGALIMEAQRD